MTGVPFLETLSWHCRRPIRGEGLSLVVCGETVPAGSRLPYCPACRAIVYQPGSSTFTLRPCAFESRDPDIIRRAPTSEDPVELVEVYQ